MIGEGHGDAVFQRRCGQGLVGWQAQLAIAYESELWLVEIAPLFDQRGLAMDIQADGAAGLVPAEPDRRTRARLSREVSGLTPFQRFCEWADFVELGGSLKDERTQRRDGLARSLRAGVQRIGHTRWRGRKGGCFAHAGTSTFLARARTDAAGSAKPIWTAFRAVSVSSESSLARVTSALIDQARKKGRLCSR